MYTISQKLKILSIPILRIGLSLVYLWFGLEQLRNTDAWTRMVPDYVLNLSSLTAIDIVRINGSFEVIFGLMLFLGLFTRFVSFILTLHIAHITYIIGFNGIGVRDFGLTIATLAIFLNGYDNFSLDWKRHKPKKIISNQDVSTGTAGVVFEEN